MSTSSRKLFPLCSAANLISLVRVLFMWQGRRRGRMAVRRCHGKLAQLSSCEMTGPDTKCHLKIRAMCHCMCVRRETNSQKKKEVGFVLCMFVNLQCNPRLLIPPSCTPTQTIIPFITIFCLFTRSSFLCCIKSK